MPHAPCPHAVLLALIQGSVTCTISAYVLFAQAPCLPLPTPQNLLDDPEPPSRWGFLSSLLGDDAPAPLTTRTSLFMLLGSTICCWGRGEGGGDVGRALLAPSPGYELQLAVGVTCCSRRTLRHAVFCPRPTPVLRWCLCYGSGSERGLCVLLGAVGVTKEEDGAATLPPGLMPLRRAKLLPCLAWKPWGVPQIHAFGCVGWW